VLQPSLTVREQQVLEQMALGLTNKQIGEKLEMSDRTVGTHVSQILAKLGAKTRTEAVTVGAQRGLLARR
jgi:DNA-binding NarL/FixJ family response regulator